MTDSSIGRVVGVLTSPTKTFAAIRERPTWLVALLTLMLVGAGTYLLMSQRMDMAEIVRESVEARGQDVPEEQLETMMDVYDKYGHAISLGSMFAYMALGFPLATLIIWVAVKLVGAELTYKQMWATFLYSQMPSLVGAVLSLPAILSRDEFHFEDVQTGSVLPSNLGFIAPEETSAGMLSLMSSLDVFTLWSVVLLILGVSTVGRIKMGTSAAAVIACFAIFVLGKAGWAAAFGG